MSSPSTNEMTPYLGAIPDTEVDRNGTIGLSSSIHSKEMDQRCTRIIPRSCAAYCGGKTTPTGKTLLLVQPGTRIDSSTILTDCWKLQEELDLVDADCIEGHIHAYRDDTAETSRVRIFKDRQQWQALL